WAICKPGRPDPLSQAANETNRSSRAEHGPVVVIHFVPQTRIADLIETHELVETPSAAVGHEQSVKGNCETRLTERLHGPRFSQNSCAGRNQNVLTAVRVDRVRDEAIDRCGRTALEPVGQNGV